MQSVACRAAVPISSSSTYYYEKTTTTSTTITNNQKKERVDNTNSNTTLILVLTLENTLELIQGDHYFITKCKCKYTSQQQQQQQQIIQGLEQACHNRVTLCFSNHQKQRWSLSSFFFHSYYSYLMDTILSALDAVLPFPLAWAIRSDICRWSQYLSSTTTTTTTTTSTDMDMQWKAFSLWMQTFFHVFHTCTNSHDIQTYLHHLTTAATTQDNSPTQEMDDDDDDDDDWEWLQTCNYHQTYQQCHSRQMTLIYHHQQHDHDHDETKEETNNNNSDNHRNDDSFENVLSWVLQHCGSQSLDWWVMQQQQPSQTQTNELLSILFDTLHLVYEDIQLLPTSNYKTTIHPLGQLLLQQCSTYAPHSMQDYIQHYNNTHNHLPLAQNSYLDSFFQTTTTSTHPRFTSCTKPPCFLSYLEQIISTQSIPTNDDDDDAMASLWQNTSHSFSSVCPNMTLYRRLFQALYNSSEENGDGGGEVELVQLLIQEGMTHHSMIFQKILPCFSIPILEVLHHFQSHPPPTQLHSLSPEGYTLIGRPDLAAIQQQQQQQQQQQYIPVRPTSTAVVVQDVDQDGLVPLEVTSVKLLGEATKLVRSSRPVFLRVTRTSTTNDHEFLQMKQDKLRLLCIRQLALPLGRGILTIGTSSSSSSLNTEEPLPIPHLCLSGRVPPNNVIVNLDTTSSSSSDDNHDNDPELNTTWPQFHNGVAAGLRLPPSSSSNHILTRTWIVYNHKASSQTPTTTTTTTNNNNNNNNNNNPESDANNNNNNNNSNNNNHNNNRQHAHGGLILALGLRGHLSSLSMTDVYEYLTQGTITTTVGILIGMAANKKGTCDPSVSKMLCLHIPSLLPPSFAAMDVASVAQTAAVTGIGLLYQGSSHRLMTEFLLNEIGKKPHTNDQNHTILQDREGYTLSCGFALGMVNLRTSSKLKKDCGGSAGLADLHMEERLYRFMVGGNNNNNNNNNNHHNTHNTTHPFHTSDVPQRNHRDSMLDRHGPEPERCSRIYEGSIINTNITAPGAIFALGMMYMKSGNKSIASLLAIPDTNFLLDYVRPDFLLYRVVSRSLVLWDDIQPSEQWIDHQNPAIVRRTFQKMAAGAGLTNTNLASFAAMTVDDNENENDSIGPEIRNIDPTNDHQPFNHSSNVNSVSHVSNKEDPTNDGLDDIDPQVDYQSIRQAYVHIVAGACFALGLRYAGTGNPDAFRAVYSKVMELRKLRDDPASLAQRPERPILDMCLSCCAVSLGMIMAGTGDMDTLKLLRVVRSKCDEGARYGTHMAVGAAIGLLFLGGGSCTLGREPEDIAALLVAFFPRYPVSSTDNQYHLQALRHCYALAVKNNKVEAIDIETSESIFLPIKIFYKDQTTKNLTTPCQLLNIEDITSLQVDSDRYFPIQMDLRTLSTLTSGLKLYVRKKMGHLSYKQDPHALRSLLIQTGGSHSDSALELIKSFTDDGKLLAYAKYLCQLKKSDSNKNGMTTYRGIFPGTLESVFPDILHHCITMEKTEAIPLYLALYDFVSIFDKHEWPVRCIWNLRITCSYYKHQCKGGRRNPLLNSLFIASISETIDKFFSENGYENELSTSSVPTKTTIAKTSQIRRMLTSCYVIWNNIPTS